MWIPTRAEAVEMFARHFEARHRGGALGKAREAAAAMKTKGDDDGHKIWTDVADVIEGLRGEEHVTQRRIREKT
jgi:hypothetical protein